MASLFRVFPTDRPPVAAGSAAPSFATPALLCGPAGLWLARHYPIMSSVLVAAFISSCVLSRAYPEARLVVVRAALPLIGIAPWAGLLTFEELDLPLPAVVAGGYGRLAFARTSREAVAATARSEHRRGEDGHALSLSFGYVRSFRSRLDRPARILGALQGKACAAR